MMPSFGQLMAMVGRSIRSPREGAAEILSFGVPREAIGTIVALVVVLSVLLAELTSFVSGAAGDAGALSVLLASPLAVGALQLTILLATIAAVFLIGRAMGGTGSIEETAVVISWLQFIMVSIQVIQTAAFVVMPPLAGLIGVAALVLFMWLLTNFVAALHGFRSLGHVFGMIVISTFTLAFVLSLILAFFGIGFGMPTGDV